MTQKFVVRLLDAEGSLLAWAPVHATAKPQDRAGSCPFWPSSATTFVVEQGGIASQLSVHWTDLDVARMQNLLEPMKVTVGQVYTFTWIEPVWLVPGMRNVPLPGVTVRAPVEVGVPVGNMNAIA